MLTSTFALQAFAPRTGMLFIPSHSDLRQLNDSILPSNQLDSATATPKRKQLHYLGAI